jgi:outer membrane protein OmpA-like peptidoglycan-associated protein
MQRQFPSAAPRLLRALALTLALACAGAPGAWAQATPAPRPPAQPSTQAAPAARPPSGGPAAAHAHPPTSTPQGKPTAAHATPPAAPPPSASSLIVPPAAPAAPVLPPPIVVPTRPPPPLTPAPVAADAPGTASTTADGLRITFGPDRADLNPESDAAITALAHAAPGPVATFNITAYAVGGDDPSTPRRLSLSRALSVRSALMQAGIASVRIYVKALGASAPTMAEGPPDRVDIVVVAGEAPAAPSAAPAPGAVPAPPAPPGPAAPWGARPATTQSGLPPTAPVPTEKAAP